MASEPENVDFRLDDRAAVVARMDALAAEGRGWVNLKPALDEEEPAPTPSLFGFLSGRGPSVPLCTWVPGERRRDRVEPAQVGIQHGAGTKAAAVLENLGVPVPPGWRVVQDHPRRGLVALLPVDVGPEAALDWLLRAGSGLAADLRLAGWWRAAIYRPR